VERLQRPQRRQGVFTRKLWISDYSRKKLSISKPSLGWRWVVIREITMADVMDIYAYRKMNKVRK